MPAVTKNVSPKVVSVEALDTTQAQAHGIDVHYASMRAQDDAAKLLKVLS